MPELTSAFINLGAVGLILWWMTQKLIPTLHQDQVNQLAAFERRVERLQNIFQQEMQYLRDLHTTSVEKLMQHTDHHIEELKAWLKP